MTDRGVNIRLATPDDAPRLVELLAGGARHAEEHTADPSTYRAVLEDIAATPGNDVLVAELDGDVVGVCQLVVFRHLQRRGGWCAEVESVHVDAAQRNSGIGTALMDEAVRRARERGCYRVQLTSHTSRLDAHRWYERLGFEPSHAGFKRYLR